MNPAQWQSLSDSQKAGQLLIVGIDGTSLDADLRHRLQAVTPGGIILFARNLVDAAQVAAFCRDLTTALPVPPFLAIDQEGGRVNRLRGIFPPIPPNLQLANASSPEALVSDHAHQTGLGLRLLGFNLNFAPVLDLSEEDPANGIGDRAYGSDAAKVARLARVFLHAQNASGVMGCGKHFPGLGGGAVDSHQELPAILRSTEDLWTKDLFPYRTLREVLPMVMVGHAYYPALQGRVPLPATLSRHVVRELLRERIGYPGVILTDDLEMGAVDQSWSPGEVVLKALEAGNDLAMYCKAWDRIEEAHATLTRALSRGSLAGTRVGDTLARIFALKERLAPAGSLPAFEPAAFAEVCQSLGKLGQTSA